MTPTSTARLPSLAPTRGRRDDTTDAALVAALRGGNERAFERLYRRYRQRIYTYVYGMVRDHGRAEDVTQEVFLSALRRMRVTERPIVFKPWIYEIAKNACIDEFRRARRGEEVSYDAGDRDAGPDYRDRLTSGSTPDVAVERKLALDNLCGAFGGLSETHHQILVLRELEGLSYREIGERLGMSRPAVESTLFRARRRLTEEYEELVSGERCRRVQAIIAGAVAIAPGLRDRRRLAVHISHCQPCRRHAAAAGLDTGALLARKSTRAKIAASFPLPVVLRRRAEGADVPVGSGPGSTLAHWSAQLGSVVDPGLMGWAKVAAAATAAAAAVGVGAGHGGSQVIAASQPQVQPAASVQPVAARRPVSAGPTTPSRHALPAAAGARARPATAAATRPFAKGSAAAPAPASAQAMPATAPGAKPVPNVPAAVAAAAKVLDGVPKVDPAATAPVVEPISDAVADVLPDPLRAVGEAVGAGEELVKGVTSGIVSGG